METAWVTLLHEATRRLAASGMDSARVDAEFLAAHVARLSRTRLITAPAPSPDQVAEYHELVKRRAAREPLQHVLGSAAFRYGELAVGPGVFVPRPETELLVEWALSRLSQVTAPLVMDLCAGSGAIGHAIAHERRDATVILVEKHDAALDWLRHNLNDTSARVIAGDATAADVAFDLNGRCDAVLSNPPYVPEHTPVSVEVAADPAAALFAGADGLDVIRPLIVRAAALTRTGGIVAIEHDDTHGTAVPALLREAGFTDVTDHPDLAGKPRFATGRWRT